jgi:hypothetical protein
MGLLVALLSNTSIHASQLNTLQTSTFQNSFKIQVKSNHILCECLYHNSIEGITNETYSSLLQQHKKYRPTRWANKFTQKAASDSGSFVNTFRLMIKNFQCGPSFKICSCLCHSKLMNFSTRYQSEQFRQHIKNISLRHQYFKVFKNMTAKTCLWQKWPGCKV